MRSSGQSGADRPVLLLLLRVGCQLRLDQQQQMQQQQLAAQVTYW
jgi:hypothetical protein